MKVLHILDELRPSGAEVMLRLSAPAWQSAGLELEVLATAPNAGPYATALAEQGFGVYHVPLRPLPRFLLGYVQLLRGGRYDVVHIHLEKANVLFGVLARLVGRSAVVRTVHNVFSFGGRLRLRRRVERAILRGLGVHHVAVGQSVAENEIRTFGNPTQIIDNTYDEGRFRPPSVNERVHARALLGLGDGDLAVAVVGNCSTVKNHVALIRALPLPSAPSAQLLHVGLESEEETGERALVDALGLTGVQYLGFVDDILPVLHASDCFVMPSRYEGLGIAALEAAACGLPLVLAEVAGLRDLKAHLPGVWWVPPEPGPIAEALAAVASLSQEERHRQGRAAAQLTAPRYGVERHVQNYLELYRGLTLSRGA